MSRHSARGSQYEKLRAQVRTEEPNCCHCGQPIDHTAPPRTRWSFSVEHLIPVSIRPDLKLGRSNARACHYGCNSKRGNRTPEPLIASERW